MFLEEVSLGKNKSDENTTKRENKQKKSKKLRYTVLLLIVALAIWTVWSNGALQLSHFTISSESLPESFDGYKIALVSDLHNAEFGENNEELIELLRKSSPDIIAITGDMIDSYRTDVDVALRFAEGAVQIAPCYYVSGNHEGRLEVADREGFFAGLEERGVTILDDEEAIIEKDGEKISLIGIIDPRINYKAVTPERLSALSTTDTFTVLLCHRPDFFDAFVGADVDLALCGHVHGGQFRLPFIGGIYGPDQGLFPEYDAGLYTQDGTNMVISRGIGNSVFPIRFNNRPELVIIELKAE